MKLSYILENSLYLELEKLCLKCKTPLREEELFSGFQTSLSNYVVKCPICSEDFVPKFTIYSEQEGEGTCGYLNGRKGQVISLLPPITLYKEFFNILMKEGDQILMNENFINNHKITFWNIVLYLKILKLPVFMLDLDYSPHHQRAHCSQIKRFLPIEKNITNLFGRKNSKTNLIPPTAMKLDSSALKKLDEIESSPSRIGSFGPGGSFGTLRKSDNSQSRASNAEGGPPQPSTGRPLSITRVTNTMMNIFSGGSKARAPTIPMPNIQN